MSSHERVAPRFERRVARLLLVDDDEPVRNVIATILRRAGHDVTVAADAKLALDAAGTTATPFELLISDVVMPGMSGVELSRELLGRVPNLKVLLLSGYPGRHAPQGGEGGMDYMAKPVTPKQLLDRVDQLLGST